MVLLRLVGLVLDLLLAPLRAIRRARAAPTGSFLTLTIDGDVADIVPARRFWQFARRDVTSLHAVGMLITAISSDRRVRGLLITIRAMSGGMAAATSLRSLLARARAAGKEVVVHLPMGGGTKEVLIASAASKVLVGPAAQLAPLGFLSNTRYFRRALDKVGVEPEVFACGEFKSAGETLTRDSMSAPQRAQLTELLDDFHGSLLGAIADGRHCSLDEARAIVDSAPYFGEECVTARLADGVAYEDEVPGRIGAESSKKRVDALDYLARRDRPLVRRPRPILGVIPIHGAIAHASLPFGAKVVTDESVIRMVQSARRNPRVAGVILHVDSPGGSALASDRMHHAIVQLAREKPVVVCMANVAASGGYYVAASAHRIVCEKTTITGSIGVVAARFTAEPLLERLGVVTETLRRGDHAGLLSPSAPISTAERAALRRELDATYRTFVNVVANGRKRPFDEVEPLARGRVYTGEGALDRGLVDALGGFDVALEELRKLIPSPMRGAARPVVIRTPRKALPELAPPTANDAGRKTLEALGELLPTSSRVLLGLGAAGERVCLLWTGELE